MGIVIIRVGVCGNGFGRWVGGGWWERGQRIGVLEALRCGGLIGAAVAVVAAGDELRC